MKFILYIYVDTREDIIFLVLTVEDSLTLINMILDINIKCAVYIKKDLVIFLQFPAMGKLTDTSMDWPTIDLGPNH